MAEGAIANIPEKGAIPNADGRIPFSIESEQAILGAILFDNEIFHRVSTSLKAEHFFDPVHRLIYEACESLIGNGRLASAVVIDAYLNTSAGFREAGGRRYLEQLSANVPSIASAPEYARIVFDLSVCRGLMEIGGTMIERARTARLGDAPAVQLEEAEQALYRLAESGKYGGGFKTFRTSIVASLDIAEKALKRGGGLAGVSTGFADLDKMMGGLHSSDLIILAGRPSMGKTSLATNIAVNAARACRFERDANGVMKPVEGAVVGFFSLEMSADQLATRIIAETSRVSSISIRRGEIDQEEFDRIYDAARALEDLPLYIDDTGGLSIAQLAARARRLKRQHGLGLLVVDYLQLLTGTNRKSENRVQEITEISLGLKTLAKELNIPIIALSQLSRQVEQREDKRPQLSDLRESGSIEQDADVVMFVYRAEYYKRREQPSVDDTEKFLRWQEECEKVKGIAEVIIGKQRHGPIGIEQLHFDETLTKFSDLDRGRYNAYRRDNE